jgi:mannose-6-phosphate isomerase-like protein (cupin superfamily)
MTKISRVVIGVNADKKSAVIYRNTDNIQAVPGVFWRSTLWGVNELPVDNSVTGDRGATLVSREPDGDGVIFRAVEIPPNPKDRAGHIGEMKALHKNVNQKYPPTEADLARHPSMHRTDTLDMFVIASGEIYMVTDADEVLLKAGDTAVVQGVNHAWDNRSDAPCMIVGVMVSAKARPVGVYPA